MPRQALTAVLLCVAMVLNQGCVAFRKSASPEVVASIRRIVIVPMEPPPLGGGGGVLESVPEGDPICGALLLATAGVLMLVSPPPDGPQPMDLCEKVEEWYASEDAWVPTVVLAKEAADCLLTTGAWEVLVSAKLRSPRSLTNRGTTWHMENWYRPLRKWYNQGTSALSREELDQQDADAVLEVGVLNYAFHREHFVFQVMTKLVTVSDGAVQARARSFVDLETDDPRKLFDDEAAGFKQLVADHGRKLLEDNLDKMGLVSR